ncbi:S41 family peptidase [Sphingomonas hylomeconis]|uniref:S41 family peptidase n=1 Tax=Sphingomonas hylomeconis TaxID=1395958 RepID=A0ABV7SZ23_9SPHN|nr:S41 family peptidase [Sphingomonas hylomeconis]
MLSACGGGGGSTGSSAGTVIGATPTPIATPSPTPTTAAGCSLRARQDWVAAQMQEWYLFPETLPTGLNPASYGTVDDYLDGLTANARAQRKDRYFTYLTSIAEEDAYYASGATAGIGVRLALDSANRLFVAESFENAPAWLAGVQRGTEIVAIGTSTANLRTVASIITSEGSAGLSNALGPDTPGTARVFQLSGVGGDRTVTIAKADYELQPVGPDGARVIEDNGKKIGYIKVRTFISTADPQLRSAFATFRAQGITDIVVDFRYNGGGLLSIAELMGNLLGGNRSTSDVFDYVTFRPEKSSNNTTARFAPQPQSVNATRIAFIGMAGTASASELVIAGMVPYLRANAGLIGTNTYGKPVGQIARDNAGCDDRLRVIALSLQNANRQGAYFDGVAGTVEASCRAGDDLSRPMGDPAEASTRQALDFLAGRACTPISTAPVANARSAAAAGRPAELLSSMRPNTAQREVPGLF